MRALVTGGAGFIGSHLVDALVARGDDVVVLDDLSTGHRENLAGVEGRVDLQVGSVADRDAVAKAVLGCDRVFHLAAVASVQRTVEAPVETNAVNFGGVLNVLEAARAQGVGRVVFASSAAVYGDRGDAKVHEDDTPNPQTPYAIEKLQAERYVRIWPGLLGQDAVALRFFNVFGPRQDPSSPYSGVVSIFVSRLLAGQPVTIFGDGEQTRDFVAVDDVVHALLAAADRPKGDGLVCNVARGEATSVNDLYRHLAEIIGVDAKPTYAPGRPGDIRHSLANNTRLVQDLGVTPRTSVAVGLRRLVDSVR